MSQYMLVLQLMVGLIILVIASANAHEVWPDRILLTFRTPFPPMQPAFDCTGFRLWVNNAETSYGWCDRVNEVTFELGGLVIDPAVDLVEFAYEADLGNVTDSMAIGGTEHAALPDIPRQLVCGGTEPHNEPPIVAISEPPDGAMVSPGSIVTVRADASDDRAVIQVSMLVNGQPLCETTALPSVCSWVVPKPKNKQYTLTAVALDDEGAEGTSAPVTVTTKTSQKGRE